jgi:hypothetical protein
VLKKFRERLGLSKKGADTQDRRRATRLPERLATGNIEGVSYQLRNWNEFGFMVAPYVGDQKIGFRIRVRLVIPFERRPVGISAEAKIVRIDRRRQELAAEFIDLDLKTKQLLERMANAHRSTQSAPQPA